MRYLKTHLGTDGKPADWRIKLLRLLLWFIPSANPDYNNKMHLVREWLVEFDDEGLPGREIGIGGDGNPIISGPDDRNYGFWHDNNMRYDDFTGEDVAKDLFESMWVSARSSVGER